MSTASPVCTTTVSARREMWGSYGETMVAVSLRQRDIVSEMNLKRA